MSNSVEALWKTVREFNLDDIRKASVLPLKIALLGSEDELIWLQDHFLAGRRDDGDRRRAVDAMRLYEPPLTAELLKKVNECTIACITPNAANSLQQDKLTITQPVYTVGNEGEWLHFKQEVLDSRRDLHLALGRNFPGLRADVLEHTIGYMAWINAEVAVVSGIATKIPVIGPIYPTVKLGDFFILTKNQVMLAFRLAGASGYSIDISQRKTEVLSIVGSGLCWRTVAKEAVSLVPGGFGLAMRGAIAFAGTYAVGKALAHYFDTGRRMSREDEQTVYRQALTRGRAATAEILGQLPWKQKRFRRRGNQ